jgi:hypothetical protein
MFARVVDSVAWYVLRRCAPGEAVFGAELDVAVTVRSWLSPLASPADGAGILGALRVIGGGRFLPPAAAVGACRVGWGSGIMGTVAEAIENGSTGVVIDGDTGGLPSCSALKLRFFRIGVVMAASETKQNSERPASAPRRSSSLVTVTWR